MLVFGRMTERERAAKALHDAELELELAVQEALARHHSEGTRERLARAKRRMRFAYERGLRALGVRVAGS